MSHKKDIIGKKFNRLTVLGEDLEKTKEMGRRYVKCLCDCGNYTSVASWVFDKGVTKSCGCLQKEKMKEFNKTKKKYSKIIVEKDFAYVSLSKSNKFAIVDLEDIDKVKDYCWRLHKGFHCFRP